MRIQRKVAVWLIFAITGCTVYARAEVTRLEIKNRVEVSAFNYEKIVGRIHFAVSPKNRHKSIIVDLDKAPRDAQGRVFFSADFYMLRPKSGGNGAALVDIVNRGRMGSLRALNRAGGAIDQEIGDGFLLRRGFTIVAVGWEFDADPSLFRLEAPTATEHGNKITGIVRAEFVPDKADENFAVFALAGYRPIDIGGPDTTLTIRDGANSIPRAVTRAKFRLAENNVVTLAGGFEPGKTYELAYRAANPPVAGLGYAAVRDVVSWLKHNTDAPTTARYVYALGASQTGRFLRDFLYLGFNSDEGNRQALDGLMAIVAGSGRLYLNDRWPTPVGCCSTLATSFPFASRALRDPVSGTTDGLLDNPRARPNQPKVFFINSSHEYWSSNGRVAALTHTIPDGTRDLEPLENERIYFMAGTQHGPGAFPPQHGTGQQLANPTDQSWIIRALLVAMDRWVREGVEPPSSQYPRIDRHTLVDVKQLAFPAIPGMHSPLALTAGVRIPNELLKGGAGTGAKLPLLAPQVDQDGNDRAGIRLPEIAVPLATYTGWNFRSPAVGASDQLYPLLGSYLPFARTKTDREKAGDPRMSVEERYPAFDRYLSLINDAAAALVKEGYLLSEDVAPVVKRAIDHWNLVMGSMESR